MPSLRLHAPGRRVGASIGLCAVVLASVALPTPAVASDGFLVVAHPDVPEPSLDRESLARLFLKKVGHWADGTEVTVLEPLRESPAYETFTREILGLSVESAEAYWQRMLFGGKVVPPQKLHEVDLLEAIAATPGSIGYVARDTVLSSDVVRLDVDGYPDDTPLAAGSVGIRAEPPADGPIRGSAAQTVQSRIYDAGQGRAVVILDVGPCGERGRRFALVNRGDRPIVVEVQISRWMDGGFKSRATRRFDLRPQGETALGCDTQGREERRWSMTGVEVQGGQRAGQRGVSTTAARDAVGWADAGVCGPKGEGMVYTLRNRVLDRQIVAKIEIRLDVPGSSRTQTRTVVLGPGGEQRLGCSLDGKVQRTFTVRSAEYR